MQNKGYTHVFHSASDIIIGITKFDWSKNKRAILIVSAIVFVSVLFFLHNKSSYTNQGQSDKNSGLTYDNGILKDLVNKDSDSDSIPDWEESLWGTDPHKKETTPGIPDKVAIDNMKQANGQDVSVAGGTSGGTQTDEFSRELVATMAALNQNGDMDQGTIDQLGANLAQKIAGAPVRKVYVMSDLKVTSDVSIAAIQKYDTETTIIVGNKYPKNQSVLGILQGVTDDSGNLDATAFTKLDPIIQNTKSIIDGMLKVSVPASLAQGHLNLTNAFEKIYENLSDMELVDTDSVIAFSAIGQYDESNTSLDAAYTSQYNSTQQKLNN